MSTKFLFYDRETMYLVPPSVDEWLPKKHIARFVVEIIDQLDLSAIENDYSLYGRKAYPVKIMFGLLIYGYATGVFSSRKIEQATYESVPFRYIAANMHPDHDTIADFRKRYSKEFENIFLQVLLIASQMGILKLGNIATDGTKIKANASKHKALSWEHANKLEKQFRDEIAKLKELAQAAESAIPDGLDIPEELSRREKRLETITEAKKELENRAKERFEQEKAEYDQKMAERKAHEEKTGKKKGGKEPQPPVEGPCAKDQVNLTDKESRIMPKSGKEFVQGFNAQASVDMSTMLIVASHVTQHTNDKQEIAPALTELAKTEKALNQQCTGMTSDTGYFSKNNVELCDNAKKVPYIAHKHDRHNKSLESRLATNNEAPPPDDADSVTKMKYRLKTSEGKKLYSKRKTTVEPVFGIIKNVMNFRQFCLRGFNAVSSEWKLIALAFNVKRMFALKA
jgi:transposase